MARYIQPGAAIDYVNPSASETINEGDIISLTTRVGVAASTVKPKALGSMWVEGVFEVPKASGAIALGAAVYYSPTSKNVSTTAADVPAGWAVEAAVSGDATVKVKIG